MGIAIAIQKMTPPKTSEAVTGAALPTIWLMLWRFWNECPRFWWYTSRQRKRPYWTYTGLSVPRKCSACLILSGVARCPAASLAGFAGTMKKIT